MPVTDLELAQAVADLYDDKIGTDPAAWLHLDLGGDDDQVAWAIRLINDVPAIVFRGSKVPLDFERDLIAIPVDDQALGLVHAGMFWGMRKALNEAAQLMAGRRIWIVGGHSLGAKRASYMAALAIVTYGCPPLALIMWGEPRGCGDKMVEILAGVPIRSYRNSNQIIHDPVTDLPPSEPIPFRHAGGAARPLIDVDEPPPGLDVFDPIAFHRFALYQAATAKLDPMPSS